MELKLEGNIIHTSGDLPNIGDIAPDFSLVKSDLTTVSLKDFPSKNILLNVFPSLDTPVCSSSVVRFNTEAAALPNTIVLSISMDLPFAQRRFCTSQNIMHVVTLSAFRNDEFGERYGLDIIDGPLTHLLARAILIIDKQKKIIYKELIPEITQAANYDAALQCLKNAG